MFTVEEYPDRFLETAFTTTKEDFNCGVYQKLGKLPTQWKSQFLYTELKEFIPALN